MRLILKHKKNGFTLIELLISLLIVGVGALGHAKMQVTSMRNAQRASFSQSANIALNDLAQRIRSLPNAALNDEFEYSNLTTGDAPSSSKLCNNDSVTCSRSEFASYELADWFDDISENLPSPRFQVAQDPANSSLFVVTLIWDADKDGVFSSTDCDQISTAISDQCEEVNLWIR